MSPGHIQVPPMGESSLAGCRAALPFFFEKEGVYCAVGDAAFIARVRAKRKQGETE